VDVVAICDIDADMLNSAKKIVNDSKKKMPEIFTGDVYAWKGMVEKTPLDGVVIATPWEWHKPMIIGSLDAGIKYVGSEVVIGITLQDHWDVVHAA
jgi:predicted dehydrogenase